jgi:hypothetical protein
MKAMDHAGAEPMMVNVVNIATAARALRLDHAAGRCFLTPSLPLYLG